MDSRVHVAQPGASIVVAEFDIAIPQHAVQRHQIVHLVPQVHVGEANAKPLALAMDEDDTEQCHEQKRCCPSRAQLTKHVSRPCHGTRDIIGKHAGAALHDVGQGGSSRSALERAPRNLLEERLEQALIAALRVLKAEAMLSQRSGMSVQQAGDEARQGVERRWIMG